MATVECLDCLEAGITTVRKPATGPGTVYRKRCHTHHQAARKRAKAVARDTRLGSVYGISGEDYEALYKAQGGRCYICRRATGRRKRLAVDHNHRTGEVRGLLCGPCNKNVVGHLRENPAAFRRAIRYVLDPPARAILNPLPQQFEDAPDN